MDDATKLILLVLVSLSLIAVIRLAKSIRSN